MERVRFLNKGITLQERENFSNWWYEQIAQFGTEVNYFRHGYTLETHNSLYGEDPTTPFISAGPVIMATNITNDSLMLSKFGIMADCDMTAMVHISAFYDTFGASMEPKAGDLIEMKEYGGAGDRPGGRGAPIYEITERDDQALNQSGNALMGHYIWIIKCKRWEYSSEPGIYKEPLSTQISDGEDGYGRDEGGANPAEVIEPYHDTIGESAKKIFDYEQNDYSSPYGNY